MGVIVYDAETIALLRNVLEEAWAALQPWHREQISKSHVAELVLKQAARGERRPALLRSRTISDAVQQASPARL
jgi:hypothetical protein